MHVNGLRALLAVAMIAWVAGCSSVVEVTVPELVDVVEADATAFSPGAIPDDLAARLATHRVVVLGEAHHLREHHEFLAHLTQSLHAHGFRQVLLETAQMHDWVLDGYASGGSPLSGWEPPDDLFGAFLRSIRAFNAGRTENDRIRIRGIDVNLDDYDGASGFRFLLGQTPEVVRDSGPVTTFLAAASGTKDQELSAIRALSDALTQGRAGLEAAWGPTWYRTVADMAEFEEASIGIRRMRQSNYDRSVRDRETVIKQLVDRRVSELGGGTIINVGDTHAQKSRLFGTDIEWLGDYLVDRSPIAAGKTFVIGSIAAAAIAPGASVPDDRLASSPPNELFRIMHETWPDRVVFLPLDDPLFARDGVVVNFEDNPRTCAPKRHFDALLVHPVAHRVQ